MNMMKKIIYRHLIPEAGRIINKNNHIPIIYYHNIVDDGKGFSFKHIDFSRFKQQVEFIKHYGYKTYKFSEIPEGFIKKPSAKEVIITFDDGFLSNYTIAFPLLKSLGIKFNIFLPAQKMELGQDGYITWEMVREMKDSGVAEFGAHTYSHIDARKISDNNYDIEITETNRLISSHIRTDVQDFCFPYGFYNKSIIMRLCRKQIYKRLYSSDFMSLKKLADSEIIGRIPISNEYDFRTFKRHLEGDYNIMYYYLLIKRIIGKRIF